MGIYHFEFSFLLRNKLKVGTVREVKKEKKSISLALERGITLGGNLQGKRGVA